MSSTRNTIEEQLFGNEIAYIPDENHIRALYNGYPLWKNKNLTYCFNTIPAITTGPESLQISMLSESMQLQVKKSFETWSQFSQLHFHQDEKNCRLPIVDMSFSGDNIRTLGHVEKNFKQGHTILLQSAELNKMELARSFKTLMHEVGHAINLCHGDDVGDDYPDKYYLNTQELYCDFTVMCTYNRFNEDPCSHLPIIPATPMPYDIDTLRFLYGESEYKDAGNSLYDLTSHKVTESLNYAPIRTISDSRINTFLFESKKDDVHINLRTGPCSRSDLGKSFTVMTKETNVSDVIASGRYVYVTLNSLNNTIDISGSKAAIIRTTVSQSGTDMIFGFDPKRGDYIVLDEPLNIFQKPKVYDVKEPVTLSGHTITQPGTLIQFSYADKILFPDVNVKDMKGTTVRVISYSEDDCRPFFIKARRDCELHEKIRDYNNPPKCHTSEDKPEEIKAFLKIINDAKIKSPETIYHVAFQSFLQGSIISFAKIFTEEVLRNIAKRNHWSDKHVENAVDFLQLLVSAYYGGNVLMLSLLQIAISRSLEFNILLKNTTSITLSAAISLIFMEPQHYLISIASRAAGSLIGGWSAKKLSETVLPKIHQITNNLFGFWQKNPLPKKEPALKLESTSFNRL